MARENARLTRIDLRDEKARCYNRRYCLGIHQHGDGAALCRHGSVAPMNGAEQRIDVRRLSRNLLLFLVLPLSLALAGDAILGVWPILTVVAVGLAFPIAGFVVSRAALDEMERVIQSVAPAVSGEVEDRAPSGSVMDVSSRGAQIAD